MSCSVLNELRTLQRIGEHPRGHEQERNRNADPTLKATGAHRALLIAKSTAEMTTVSARSAIASAEPYPIESSVKDLR
jgi:hypothetical protein